MKNVRKKSKLDLEETYEKLQHKVFPVMGMLDRLFRSVRVATESVLKHSKYERKRRNVLSSIPTGSPTLVSVMLKNNKEILCRN